MLHPPLKREPMLTAENPEFSRKNVEALAEWQGNPDWMRQIRLDYFALYQELPMPGKKDEDWRRTDISALAYDRFAPFNPTRQTKPVAFADLPQEFKSLYPAEYQGRNLCVKSDGGTSNQFIDSELRSKGVIWTDLKTAVRDHPQLTQKYFMKSIERSQEGKFGALHTAFWNSGMFLYVPKNVELALPLHVFNWIADSQIAHFPHTLIVVDQGAQVTYFEEYASPESTAQHFFNAVVEIFVEEAAKLQYVSLQNFAQNVFNFTHKRAHVDRDGTMNWLVGTFGSTLTKSVISSVLLGQGAQTEMLGLSVGEEGQFIDQQTHQIHEAPYTKSDLLFKTAVKESGHSLYKGVIRIAQHAQKSDAYQANRNLMLGENARAESIPGLEIIANDVRCTHGATVGKVDADQLFYLQSRGLKRSDAIRVIVDGFFDPVLQRIPHQFISERMHNTIQAKIKSVKL